MGDERMVSWNLGPDRMRYLGAQRCDFKEILGISREFCEFV